MDIPDNWMICGIIEIASSRSDQESGLASLQCLQESCREEGKKETINENFLQNQRLSSQGGFITFFYDERMEVEEAAFPISVIAWKSYKVSDARSTPYQQHAKR